MANDSLIDGPEHQPATRELRVALAGSHCLGIFTEEVDTIAKWRTPTPLPDAPPSVRGVVCLRGRILTVLDAATLLGEVAANTPRCIVSLTGDEQLALALDSAEELLEIRADQLGPLNDNALILGRIQHADRVLEILNVRELFATAIRGRERRRRRF